MTRGTARTARYVNASIEIHVFDYGGAARYRALSERTLTRSITIFRSLDVNIFDQHHRRGLHNNVN